MGKISSPINYQVNTSNDAIVKALGFSVGNYRFLYELPENFNEQDLAKAHEITQLYASAGFLLRNVAAAIHYIGVDPQLAKDILRNALWLATDCHPENFIEADKLPAQFPQSAKHLSEIAKKRYFLFGTEAVDLYFEQQDGDDTLDRIAKLSEFDIVVYDPLNGDEPSGLLSKADGWGKFAEITEQEAFAIHNLRPAQ